MKPKEIKGLVHDASVAHCDLNIFYAIIALAENSLISATHSRGCERIIKICRAESHKALIRYDRHVAKLTERPVLPADNGNGYRRIYDKMQRGKVTADDRAKLEAGK